MGYAMNAANGKPQFNACDFHTFFVGCVIAFVVRCLVHMCRSANGNYAHPRLPPSPLKSQHGGNGYGAAATAQNDPRRCGSQASQSYTSINPNITYLVSPGKQYLASQFMGEQLRKDMQQRTYLGQAQVCHFGCNHKKRTCLVPKCHEISCKMLLGKMCAGSNCHLELDSSNFI